VRGYIILPFFGSWFRNGSPGMCAKYLSSALLLLLLARFAESQEPTSHPIHHFFFFNGAGDFNWSARQILCQ
jgi:hypothetical protein